MLWQFLFDIFAGAVILLLLETRPLSARFGDDSANVFCNITDPPKRGEWACYQVNVINGQCDIGPRIHYGEIVEQNRMITFGFPDIEDPDVGLNSEYPNQVLCKFFVPSCNNSSFAHYGWTKFKLEQPCRMSDGSTACLDLVNVPGISVEDGQQDKNLNFCGCQPIGNFKQIKSRDLNVTFRSNKNGSYPGFRMKFLCYDPNPGSPGPPGPSGLPGPPRTDGTIEPPPALDTCDGPNFNPPPVFTRLFDIPQNGSDIRLPLPVFLTYSNSLLKVVQNEDVLRTFSNISRLFFWSGMSQTVVFKGSANVPDGDIYGGGRLLVIDDCAYYVTLEFPPKFRLTAEQSSVVAFLVNALDAFNLASNNSVPAFTSQLPTVPSTTSPIKPTSGLKGSSPQGKKEAEGYSHLRRILDREPVTSPPPESDPRFNVNALSFALRFQNSCNNLLRGVSRAYIERLREENLLGTQETTGIAVISVPGQPTEGPIAGPRGLPTITVAP